jgi:hypothetical protein
MCGVWFEFVVIIEPPHGEVAVTQFIDSPINRFGLATGVRKPPMPKLEAKRLHIGEIRAHDNHVNEYQLLGY